MKKYRRFFITLSGFLGILFVDILEKSIIYASSPLSQKAPSSSAAVLSSLSAQNNPPPKSREEFLKGYEKYLNEIKTLEAYFIQRNPEGEVSTGKLYMQRPHRLRLEYDPPNPLLVIARDGSFFTYDRNTKSSEVMSTDDTPAGFILKEKISFKRDVVVKDIQVQRGLVRLCLEDMSQTGTLTLVFNENPIYLKQWVIKDSMDQETQVTLTDLRLNHVLPKVFEVPS